MKRNYKILNDKKAEKYLSPWLFLIFAIIGTGIIIGVIIFYSKAVDVRAEEAYFLTTRISDCIIDNGYLKNSFFDADFDIFKECSLNHNILDKSGYFYFDISIYDESEKLLKETEKGDRNLKIQWEIKKEEEHFAECFEQKVRTLSDYNQKYLLN